MGGSKKGMSKKRAFITGITGFVGPYMAELLLQQGDFEVFGSYRKNSSQDTIEHIKDRITLIEADLLDADSMDELIKESHPEYIFHLAAQSNVRESWKQPAMTMEVNAVGTVNLFEAIRKAELDPVIQVACSSEEYGFVNPDELPVDENNLFRPMSPYAVSRVAVDLLGYQYFKSYDMKIIRTRTFNHTGPRQSENFVCSKFTKHVVEMEKGLREPVLTVGNLDAKRDFTDVRDIVRSYLLAVTKGIPSEEYVICSGKGRAISEILQIVLDNSSVKVEIEKDPALARPSDVPELFGDYSKFTQATGWVPEYSLEQTIKDMMDYWRNKL